ncbi:MAG: SRPBCC family protein [Myxococcaceae bacterium]|nr:SRPBCC family protein [Myxococcaceae bacterium]
MTVQPVHCSTFVLDRIYSYAPERVFAAWATAETKSRWFAGPDGWTELERVLELRPGGRETCKGRFPDGKVSYFDARFHEVIPNQLLVYAYDMYVNDQKLSVSLASVEFLPEGAGTHLRVTEQGVFFLSKDDAPGREQGTVWLLDKLAAALSNPHAAR